MRSTVLVAGLVAAVSCAPKTSSAPPQLRSLDGGNVARVGTVTLPGSLLEQVSSAQRTSIRDALARLVDDALVASEASSNGLDSTAPVVAEIKASGARLVIARASAAARSAGPPSDAEVVELTRVHWQEVDLPDQVRVIHAVVLRSKPANSSKDAAAKKIADLLAISEAGALDAKDFESRANAIPHAGFDLRVETLEPFVADGRSATSPTQFDPSFAAASTALALPGATTGVVESAFGWHVIRLLERLPGKHMPIEERRVAFAEEVRAIRAKKDVTDTLARLHNDSQIEVANGVDDLLTIGYEYAQRNENVGP